MAQEAQKSRITEIQVRMDCNGCVQKIKKALHGINGIYDLYIDLPQQKITIVGWADPEKIVKAIKKTRKSAIICSHVELPDQPPAQPVEPPPEGGARPSPDSANPPPGEPSPPADTTPSAEPPKDPPPPPPEAKPSPDQATQPSTETKASQQTIDQQPTRPKDVEEVHVIYHYPPDYGYGYNISHGYGGAAAFRAEPPIPPPPMYGNNNISHTYNGRTYSNVPPFRPEPPHAPPPLYNNTTIHGGGYGGPPFKPDPSPPPPPPPQPQYATHSYNTHRPSPYVTQYEYIRPPQPPPPPPQYANYSRPVPYNEDYHYHMGNNGNGSIGSVFSDENPNACTIV